MLNIVSATHNIVRWIVIILAVFTLARAYLGWFGKRAWTPMDRKLGVFFGSALDVQFLLGILLIILIGITNLGSLLIDHIVPMFLAIVVVHVGSILSRKAEQDTDRFRRAALFYTLAVVIILIAIPWNEPLLPGLTST